jgi:hypothetical protein
MAQKIHPRFLRFNNILSSDFSFFSDKAYAALWANGYNIKNALYCFSLKNLLYKNKPKASINKRPSKKKKQPVPSFIHARFYISNYMGALKFYPILFKFANMSLSKKYNPIKATYVGRRFTKNKKFVKTAPPFLKSKV